MTETFGVLPSTVIMTDRFYIRLGEGKLNPARLARFSKRIRKERGGKCERCGDDGDQIHHVFEKALYPIFAFEPDNVVVLCPGCHRMATLVQRTSADFRYDFFSSFPKAILNRMNEFRSRAEKILSQNNDNNSSKL